MILGTSRVVRVYAYPAAVDLRKGYDGLYGLVQTGLKRDPLPGRPTKKQLVRRVMQRWRIERTYQDLKDELGLDHYEGRRFPGWHHHVSVVLCFYAFVIAKRVRHFPPSATRSLEDHAQSLAA